MEQLGVTNSELTPIFYGVQNITWGNFNIMVNSNASSESFLSVLPLVLIVIVAVAVVIAIVMIVRRK